MPLDRLGNAVFASTGGHPSETQIRRVLDQTPSATQHLCFDNDRAGQSFTETFKAIHQEMGLDATRLRVELPAAGYKDWNDQVMGKQMPEATEKIESDSVEKTEEQERPHFRR
jgi:DNA primase